MITFQQAHNLLGILIPLMAFALGLIIGLGVYAGNSFASYLKKRLERKA